MKRYQVKVPRGAVLRTVLELAEAKAEVERLKREAGAAEGIAVQWAHSAGFSTGHGDTLADILTEMRSQHCDERDEARAKVAELDEHLNGAARAYWSASRERDEACARIKRADKLAEAAVERLPRPRSVDPEFDRDFEQAAAYLAAKHQPPKGEEPEEETE